MICDLTWLALTLFLTRIPLVHTNTPINICTYVPAAAAAAAAAAVSICLLCSRTRCTLHQRLVYYEYGINRVPQTTEAPPPSAAAAAAAATAVAAAAGGEAAAGVPGIFFSVCFEVQLPCFLRRNYKLPGIFYQVPGTGMFFVFKMHY